ncbi:MAG TPA: sigma-70 family RNA polymerase sigma factor [Polyangia bacterium]
MSTAGSRATSQNAGPLVFAHLPPRLSPEEESQLLADYKVARAPAVEARLVTANLRLVVKMARQHDRTGHMLADLVQEGCLGLIEAIRRFDPERGVRLSTYAAFWIRAYLTKYKMDNARLVRGGTTRAARLAFFRGEPGPTELSLEGNVSHEIDRPLSEVLADDAVPTDVRLEQVEAATHARRCTRRVAQDLDGLEEAVLQRRLLAEEPEPLRVVGKRLAISGERVRQIEQRLVAKLRAQYTRIPQGAAA